MASRCQFVGYVYVSSKFVSWVLIVSHIVWTELLVLYILINSDVNMMASCFRLGILARFQRWIFLRCGLSRGALVVVST